jgi:hypothetical protein
MKRALALLLVLCAAGTAHAATSASCTRDSYKGRKSLDVRGDGVANFAVVAPGKLYRGSQPFNDGRPRADGTRPNGFDTLRVLGVRCRILLRPQTVTESGLDERSELESRGIRLYHLPLEIPKPPFDAASWTAYLREATRVRDRFLRIVRSKKSGPCFVSCRDGKDRTGLLVAWYRAAVQGWKPRQVFREQERCQFEPQGMFGYLRRIFCGWYREKLGADPACDAVLGP